MITKILSFITLVISLFPCCLSSTAQTDTLKYIFLGHPRTDDLLINVIEKFDFIPYNAFY